MSVIEGNSSSIDSLEEYFNVYNDYQFEIRETCADLSNHCSDVMYNFFNFLNVDVSVIVFCRQHEY